MNSRRLPLVLVEDGTSRVLIIDDEHPAIRTYGGVWKARAETEAEVVTAVELKDFRHARDMEAMNLIDESRAALRK